MKMTPPQRSSGRDLRPNNQSARIVVRKPTTEATSRWVCSKKIPPIHLETGKKNML